MEIKPPGPGKPFFEPGKELGEIGKKRDDVFAGAVTRPVAGEAETSAPSPGLSGVATRFSKLDLQDPEKLESIIQSSVKELLDTEFGQQFGLSEAQRAQIGNWMGGDPMLRRQIERYLERVLK